MPRNDRGSGARGGRAGQPQPQQPEFALESFLGSDQSAALIQQVANAAAQKLAQAGLQQLGLPNMQTSPFGMTMSMGSPDSSGTPSSAGDAPKEGKKKGSHSEIERRRRDLINERIEELRRIVPEAASSKGNKASILGDAIEHVNNLQGENARLQREKDAMMAELERFRVSSLTDPHVHTDAAIAKRKRRAAEDGGRPDAFIDAVTARQVHYEAIATIGAVQNYGLLFAVRDTDWTIAQVSNNVEALLAIPADQLLNQPLSAGGSS
eukprot:tig00020510_g9922.t1